MCLLIEYFRFLLWVCRITIAGEGANWQYRLYGTSQSIKFLWALLSQIATYPQHNMIDWMSHLLCSASEGALEEFMAAESKGSIMNASSNARNNKRQGYTACKGLSRFQIYIYFWKSLLIFFIPFSFLQTSLLPILIGIMSHGMLHAKNVNHFFRPKACVPLFNIS